MNLPWRKGIYMISFMSVPLIFQGQDLLYRKDSVISQAEIREFHGRSIVYTIPGDSVTKYYQSTSYFDSILYDGKKFNFSMFSRDEQDSRKLIRNYFSTELINLFSGRVNFDYERLSASGQAGFVAGFLINLKESPQDSYYNVDALRYASYAPLNFFIKGGLNWYPFNYSTRAGIARFSSGIAVFAGSVRKIDWERTYSEVWVYDNVPVASLLLNAKERLFLGDNFQLTGALEVSLLPFLAYLCPQVGVSVSF